MSFLEFVHRVFGRSRPPVESSPRDKLTVAGDLLTLQVGSGQPMSFHAKDVTAIWYDYNPFGWCHANSVRLSFTLNDRSDSVDIYDERHTYEPLFLWLQQNFPALVANQYRELWGHPGGDEPSVLLWTAGDGEA